MVGSVREIGLALTCCLIRIRRFVEWCAQPRRGPQPCSKLERVDDAVPRPPRALIAGTMQLVVVHVAQGHGELVGHLHRHGAGLRKSEVVRLGGIASADETGLAGNEREMLLVSQPFFFGTLHERRGCEIGCIVAGWLCQS